MILFSAENELSTHNEEPFEISIHYTLQFDWICILNATKIMRNNDTQIPKTDERKSKIKLCTLHEEENNISLF